MASKLYSMTPKEIVAELDKYIIGQNEAKKSVDKPTVIIANTVKGNGISFMENDILWHYRFPHEGEEYDGALKELHAAMPEGVKDPYEEEAK